jgi:hypothetical protein
MTYARRVVAHYIPCLAFAYGLTAQPAAAGDRGADLARRVQLADEGFGSEQASVLLELFNAHGELTTRRLRLETLEVRGDGDRSRAVFDWPADVRGTKLLTWTHRRGEDEQWLYMPSVKRVKRISSTGRSAAFMGSEFAYEDLGSWEVEKYRFRYLDDAQERSRPCWRLERVPLDPSSNYKKQIVWIDREYLSPVRIDYYDRKDQLMKTGTARNFQRLGSRFWRMAELEMQNHQTGKRSVLRWSNRKLGEALPPEQFESANLED